MAAKRSTPLEDPPTASSCEEEETTSGDEEEEESSDEEIEDPAKKLASPPSQSQAAKLAPKKPDSAESESESESESGSESEPSRPSDTTDSTVRPISSKPMEETPTKKPRSKPLATALFSSKSTATKRGSETEQGPEDNKRVKKDLESDVAVEKSEDKKKALFQRLWSEDDEIAVLKGIIEFSNNKGIDPVKDMNAFYEFVKKSMHFDFTIAQLKDKVWRLKKKFNNLNKRKEGENRTFSKAHDQKIFDLSKKIWGSERPSGLGELSVKSNGKAKKANSKDLAALKTDLGISDAAVTEKVDKVDVLRKELVKFDKDVGVSGMEAFLLTRGMDVLKGAKKAEMEDKCRKLHAAELEVFLKRNALMREQAGLLLAAYKAEED